MEYSIENVVEKLLNTKDIVPKVPVSAHGTNPAGAAMCGMKIVSVGTDTKENIDIEELRKVVKTHKDNLSAHMRASSSSLALCFKVLAYHGFRITLTSFVIQGTILIPFLMICSSSLCRMRKMPGIISQMPPFPISMNEDLASSIFPNKLEFLFCDTLFMLLLFLGLPIHGSCRRF